MLVIVAFVSAIGKVKADEIHNCSEPCLGNKICTPFKGSFDCLCSKGFYSDPITNNCEDSNECEYRPCDTRYFTCHNLVGDYECRCKPGTFGDANDVCRKLVSTDTLNYHGCFKEFEVKLEEELIDLPTCQSYCASYKYSYIAVKANKWCYCGSEYDKRHLVPKEYCSIKCDMSHRSCGGETCYSVYLVEFEFPSFQGCFEIGAELKYSKISSRFDMTVGKCLRICDSFQYAALQNGSVCKCSEDIEPAGGTDCLVKCSGDPQHYCGGEDKMSIFRTCKVWNSRSVKCSRLFHCQSFDEYGVCKSDCEEGFIGDHCYEKIEDIEFPMTINPVLYYWIVLVCVTIPAICSCHFAPSLSEYNQRRRRSDM